MKPKYNIELKNDIDYIRDVISKYGTMYVKTEDTTLDSENNLKKRVDFIIVQFKNIF